jgi:hypothetical protein
MGNNIYPGIEPTAPSKPRVKTHQRPKLLDVAAALAIWAEEKPDCVQKQHILANTIPVPKGRTFRRISRIGTTGACLIDKNGLIRTVEGSGWEHVSLSLCTKYPQLIKESHLVVSRQLCSTCIRRLIQSGVSKITVVQHDCQWPNVSAEKLKDMKQSKKNRVAENFFRSFFRASKEPPQDYIAFEASLSAYYNSPEQSTLLAALCLVPDSLGINAQKAKEIVQLGLWSGGWESFIQQNLYSTDQNLFTHTNISLSTISPSDSIPFKILRQLQQRTKKPDIDTWSFGCALLLSCRSQYIGSIKDSITQTHVGAIALNVSPAVTPKMNTYRLSFEQSFRFEDCDKYLKGLDPKRWEKTLKVKDIALENGECYYITHFFCDELTAMNFHFDKLTTVTTKQNDYMGILMV